MPTTARQLDNAFKLYLDKVDSQAVPDFLVEEREQFLNDAQLYLARRITSRKSQDQDDIDLRRVLSKTASLPLSTDNPDGAYEAVMPEDYLSFGNLMVNVAVVAGPITSATKYVKPLLVAEDELATVLSDPFNRPTSGNPVICFTANKLQVYGGQDTVHNVRLSYYKLPSRIAVNSNKPLDLPEALLPSLVQRAVQLALESISDPRFQTQNAILKSTENPL